MCKIYSMLLESHRRIKANADKSIDMFTWRKYQERRDWTAQVRAKKELITQLSSAIISQLDALKTSKDVDVRLAESVLHDARRLAELLVEDNNNVKSGAV